MLLMPQGDHTLLAGPISRMRTQFQPRVGSRGASHHIRGGTRTQWSSARHKNQLPGCIWEMSVGIQLSYAEQSAGEGAVFHLVLTLVLLSFGMLFQVLTCMPNGKCESFWAIGFVAHLLIS